MNHFDLTFVRGASFAEAQLESINTFNQFYLIFRFASSASSSSA
jgi:hypothetical protein